MRKAFVPQAVIPGVRRRINPDTLMPEFDKNGDALWDMPVPLRYDKHTRWCKHKHTGERVMEPIMVPIYRGTSASYARWVKAQLRRQQRKAAELQAAVDALNEVEQSSLQEAEKAITDLVLNPGGHNVG